MATFVGSSSQYSRKGGSQKKKVTSLQRKRLAKDRSVKKSKKQINRYDEIGYSN